MLWRSRDFVVLLACLLAVTAAQTPCTGSTPVVPCCWQMPSGNIYDLTQSYNGQEYHFSDGTNDYYWSPCHIPVDCQTGTPSPICQHTTTDTTFGLGAVSGAVIAELSPPGSGVTINYPPNKSTPKNTRQSVLTLVCDQTQSPGVPAGQVTENPVLTYQLSFKSKFACPSVAPTPGPNNNSGGGFDMGWVFVIIVLVGSFVYVVGGTMLNHFYFGAELGLSAIPQWEFWIGVPSLMKDGAMFVYNKITGKEGSTSHYQQI